MWIFLLFLAIPLIEIGLFIQVGGLIGLWPTLGIVVLTAIAGTWLVRSQGAREMANLRSSFSDLRDPTEPLANGAMILLAGALLLTPGFFTDSLGLLLLLPPVRNAVFRYLRNRVNFARFDMGPGPGTADRRPGDVIDADFSVIDPDKTPTHRPSDWTRH